MKNLKELLQIKVDKNNKLVDFLRNFSLIYSISYILFAFLLYLPFSYFFLFLVTKSAQSLNFEIQKDLVFNLIGFFLHILELNPEFWNIKEIIHYTEVRFIYDLLFLIFLFSIFFILFFKINLRKIRKIIKITFIIANIPLLIIPIFSFFWNKIFHVILFNNDLWILEQTDISFYLFNDYFFIGFILLWYLLILIIFCISNFYFKNNNSSKSK